MDAKIRPLAIWALGATQIIGYGTVYYSFSVLAPAISESFGWSAQWIYAALSVSLLAGGLVSPIAGQMIDRFGAGHTMTAGSILVALALGLAAIAPSGWAYAGALILMEILATLVLYASAFAALVQIGGHSAQRSITHLTLIAGFASTLFWPLTSWLLSTIDWRATYLVYAALNLVVCAPLHWWLGSLANSPETHLTENVVPAPTASARPPILFALLMCGFAVEGFTLSGILMHIAPMLDTLGLGGTGIIITTLFGPAQVLSRLVNMMFGAGLRQVHLAIITSMLPPLAVAVLATTAPSAIGGVAFAILLGLGSGLTSIISGSLPLELYGRNRYGTRLGWLSSSRQIASAVAPFILALGMTSVGITMSLAGVVALGIAGVAIFALVAVFADVRSAPGAFRSETPMDGPRAQ
ncbi:MAG: arsenite efflux MFS transporter ArsK [Devosia sp.]